MNHQKKVVKTHRYRYQFIEKFLLLFLTLIRLCKHQKLLSINVCQHWKKTFLIAKSIHILAHFLRIYWTYQYFCLSSFQIYPDPDSEKVIMGSLVFCIHHKEGCKWSDELRRLKVRIFEPNLNIWWLKRVGKAFSNYKNTFKSFKKL